MPEDRPKTFIPDCRRKPEGSKPRRECEQARIEATAAVITTGLFHDHQDGGFFALMNGGGSHGTGASTGPHASAHF